VQNSFGAAVIAGREQFKRTDAVGLDVTPAVSGRHSQVFTGLSPFNRYRDTLFQCVEPNLTMGLDGYRVGPLYDFKSWPWPGLVGADRRALEDEPCHRRVFLIATEPRTFGFAARCYVDAGYEPADWHPDCRAAYAR
jgi:hypothetical protein